MLLLLFSTMTAFVIIGLFKCFGKSNSNCKILANDKLKLISSKAKERSDAPYLLAHCQILYSALVLVLLKQVKHSEANESIHS